MQLDGLLRGTLYTRLTVYRKTMYRIAMLTVTSDSTTAPAVTLLARRWVLATVAATVISLVTAALFAPARDDHAGDGLLALLFVGYAMHVAASGWLVVLHDVRSCVRRHRVRFVAVPAALVVAACTAVPLLGAVPLQLGLEVFFAWQLFHYAKQNVGIAALASVSLGAGPLRRLERRCVVVAGCWGIVAFLARPELLDLRDPPAFPALFSVAALGFGVTVVVGLAAVARRPRHERPLQLVACLATSLAFTAPMYLAHTAIGAVGGMTIAHGLQYLILVGLIAARGPSGRSGRWSRIGSLVAVALLGGVFLKATSHLSHTPGPARAVFGVYLGLLAAHFVIDAGLWRLRDPAARAFVTRALPDLFPQRQILHPHVLTTSGADI
jgi:hypothetical protein